LAIVFADSSFGPEDFANIAREFGFSETSFVYREEGKPLRVRSFTPAGIEINGAGHNLLGAVGALLEKRVPIFEGQGSRPHVIMKDRTIFVEVDGLGERPRVGLRQRPASMMTQPLPVEQLGEGLSLHLEDFHGKLKPTIVATEVAHLMVPLKDIAALNRAQSNKKILYALGQEYGFQGVYCFTPATAPDTLAEARFFNPSVGIDEDPATGSAAGPLAGFLHASGFAQADETYRIHQGKQQLRPSVIYARITSDAIVVSGSTVITMEGILRI